MLACLVYFNIYDHLETNSFCNIAQKRIECGNIFLKSNMHKRVTWFTCTLFYCIVLWVLLIYFSQRCCRSPSDSTWCWWQSSVSPSHSLTWTCTSGNDRLFQINHKTLRVYKCHWNQQTVVTVWMIRWASSLTWASAELGSSTRVFVRWAGYAGDLTGPSCFLWDAVQAVQGPALNTPDNIWFHTLTCAQELTEHLHKPCMYSRKALLTLEAVVWSFFCSHVDISCLL